MEHICWIIIFLFNTAIQGIHAANAATSCETEVSADWCYGGSVSVTCDNICLPVIPDDLPKSVVCLRIRNTNISKVDNLQNYINLRHLDLSSNNISNIGHTAFLELEKLETLNLSNNALNWSTIPTRVFRGLHSLTTLNVSNNIWQNNSRYRDDIFARFTNLRVLHIDGLPDGIAFGPDFKSLIHLQELHVHGGFDIIKTNTCQVFREIPVTQLRIWSGVLTYIEEFAFVHFTQLKVLSLSNNRNLGMENAINSFRGLSPTLEHLYLQHLICNEYYPINITANFFHYLNLTNLKTLWLDHNNIFEIESGFASNLPKLEALSLNCNRLQTSLFLFQDICNLANLRYLSLAYQSRTHLGMDCNDDTLYQKSKDNDVFSEYKHSYGEDARYYCPCSLQYNKTYHPVWILPIKLEILNYRGSLLIYEAAMGHDLKLYCNNSLTFLDFSWNYINRLKGELLIEYPNKEKDVTFLLEYNTLTYLNPFLLNTSISEGLRVGALSFFGNRLGLQMEQDKEGLTFSLYKDLKHLNLGSNHIKTLLPNVFQNMTSLKTLNLTMNFLRRLDFTFSHMKNITYIDLSMNIFASLTQDSMTRLNAFGDKLHVDLSGNPLICSCSTLDFLKWIRVTKVYLKNYNNYECMFENRKEFMALSLFYDRHFSNMEKSCYSKSYVFIAGLVTGFAVFIGAVTLCAYRHRWHVKFFILHIREKYSRNSRDRSEYKYDAFVAYHSSDLDWVTKELMTHLDPPGVLYSENDQDHYKLCVHHRDFIPGTSIEENIVDGIENSRKTILVLSPMFVRSSWCDFELHVARKNSIDKGRDLIVVIKLEDVPWRAMSKTLSNLIRRITYIEWPTNPIDRPEFWNRVRESLKGEEVLPQKCECGRTVRRNGHHQTAD